MTIKWKAAIAGGTVAGIGLGGFAAADGIDRQTPGDHTLQQSAGSPASAPLRLKFKGGSWYPHLAGSDGLMSVSVASPFSSNDGGSANSAASPGSVDSPASPNSGGGTGSAGSVASPDSPASPPNGGGGGGGGGSASGSGGGSGS